MRRYLTAFVLLPVALGALASYSPKAQATPPVQVQTIDSESDIIQINNLVIQRISYSPQIIFAFPQGDAGCRGYYSVSGGGFERACPPLQDQVQGQGQGLSVRRYESGYEIAVDYQTILLLRTRARASFNDFAVGDRINVFGFLNPDGRTMQALILRDLDKPAVGEQYIQINNLQMISNPTSYAPPATFTAVPAGLYPCLGYASAESARSYSVPCPLLYGTSNPSASSGGISVVFPGFQEYTIQVTPQTRILNKFRVRSSLGILAAGHNINVFGRYNPSTRVMEALVIRDLSSDGTVLPPPNYNSIRVTVTDRDLFCIATVPITGPCSPLDGVAVTLRGGPNNVSMIMLTDRGGRAIFSNLAAGTYIVSVNDPGYGVLEKSVAVGIEQKNEVYFSISNGSVNRNIYLDSINPGAGYSGTNITLGGRGFSGNGNIVRFEMDGGNVAYLPDMFSNGNTITFQAPDSSSYACSYSQYRCLMPTKRLDPGVYRVWVENSAGKSNTLSFLLYSDSYLSAGQ